MPDRSPLEIIDRFAKAVEAHPEARPFSEEERQALDWLVKFRRRVETLVWFWAWGKWFALGLVFIVTQWDRIAGAWTGWNGQ